MFQGKYTIYGADASYFTRKVQAVFRYMDIPHDYVYKTQALAPQIEQRVGTHLIPVVLTPENWMIWDSTPIAMLLDRRYPDRAILPSTPVQRIACRIFEDWMDEWFTRAAVHYRWYFEPTARERGRAIGANMLFGLPVEEVKGPDRSRALDDFARNIKENFGFRACRAVGADEQHADEVRGRFEYFVETLAKHLKHHRCLFGDRPSIADFAIIGPVKAHFGADPSALEVLKARGPEVLEYSDRLWNQKAGPERWMAADAIPETLIPMFEEMAVRFHVYLRANRDAVAAGERSVTVDLGYKPTTIRALPYREASRLDVADEIARLSRSELQRVRDVLGPTGALAVYELPPIGDGPTIAQLAGGVGGGRGARR